MEILTAKRPKGNSIKVTSRERIDNTIQAQTQPRMCVYGVLYFSLFFFLLDFGSNSKLKYQQVNFSSKQVL